MTQLYHPNIVKTIDVFKHQNRYYVVQEYCKGGYLLDELQKIVVLNEPAIAFII